MIEEETNRIIEEAVTEAVAEAVRTKQAEIEEIQARQIQWYHVALFTGGGLLIGCVVGLAAPR
jgi:hypothetical protein